MSLPKQLLSLFKRYGPRERQGHTENGFRCGERTNRLSQLFWKGSIAGKKRKFTNIPREGGEWKGQYDTVVQNGTVQLVVNWGSHPLVDDRNDWTLRI